MELAGLPMDSLISLAFSVYSGKGVYALLLGSGISRAAEIPTGWEVTLDLVRKIAAAEKESCEPDPESWYRKRYGIDPTYSNILEGLATTPADRNFALATYFEASPKERDDGKKVPTTAHKAIARLVSKGYIRVIITTNFDRLMEQALEAEGVSPAVISTSDMAQGAMPLTHAACTLVKVHGDYKDTRIRNTELELGTYDVQIDKLLDRIFDEYGLVVCGWSATWDYALRAAMLRSPNRRFSCYWGQKDTPSEPASDLIKSRQIATIVIDSADEFFSAMEQKIDALELFNRPHPLSITLAVASIKKFLPEERFRIELRDLVMDEVERQIKTLAPLSAPYQLENAALKQIFDARLQLYESSMEMLLNLLANGCYYGIPMQAKIWQDAILRILELSTPQGGNPVLLNLRRYPACLLLYASGVAAVASSNYHVLRTLLVEAKSNGLLSLNSEDTELIFNVIPFQTVDGELLTGKRSIPPRVETPVSDHLHTLLRPVLRRLIPSDLAYEMAFDRFEYLYTLTYYDRKSGADDAPDWAPGGRFIWRGRGYRASGKHVSQLLAEENEVEQSAWPPIRAGLFVSAERFKAVNDAYQTNILSRIRLF